MKELVSKIMWAATGGNPHLVDDFVYRERIALAFDVVATELRKQYASEECADQADDFLFDLVNALRH